MKKFFTLLVAVFTTTTMMAQMPSTMKFVGQSAYSATIMGITASGGSENDTLAVSNIDATNKCSDITIPSMTVEVSGMFSKTVPLMTLTGVSFTMSMAGGVNITWAADSLQYTVMDGGEEKVVIVKNLAGSFSTSSNKMNLTFNMKYGSMPGELTFTENDAAYFTPDGISEVLLDEQNDNAEAHKVLINGKLVITKNGKQYNAAGTLLK